MFKSYISLLLVVSCLTGCSISHTNKIRHQLGYQFNEKVYLEQGGEESSLRRTKIFCDLMKTKKLNKQQLQFNAIQNITGAELSVVNAEISIADKECK